MYDIGQKGQFKVEIETTGEVGSQEFRDDTGDHPNCGTFRSGR